MECSSNLTMTLDIPVASSGLYWYFGAKVYTIWVHGPFGIIIALCTAAANSKRE